MASISPPASANGEDSPTPRPGFGWEFEQILEARLHKKEHEMHARFQRYHRFGMKLEEARLPTPERFRNAYDEYVDAIANDRTPSPSPEAQATMGAVTRNPQRVDTIGENKLAWPEVVDEANSTNYYRCAGWNDGIGATDSDKFVTYDAYFNGTLNLNYIPVGDSPRRPYLTPVNASLAIGQMVLPSDPSVDRSKWSANNFFLSFTTFEPLCGNDATCPPSFYALSDSSGWYWSQAWKLFDTKNGDGFDISGSITKTKAMGGNGLYFAFPADDTYTKIESFDDEDLFWNDYVSMTGHISPTAASVTFTVSNYSVGSNAPFANLQYTFTGTAWEAGAKLTTSGTHPTTTGQSKAVVPPPATTSSSSGSSSSTSGISHTIIGAATGGGFLLLLIIVCLAFCFCCGKVSMARKNRKQQRNLDQEYQQQRGVQEQSMIYAPGQHQTQPAQPPKYAQ